MASPDKDDFCGKCFPGAKVGKDKHCGTDSMACHSCGGHAKWCGPKESSDNAERRKLTLEVTDGRGYLLPKDPTGAELQLLHSDGVSKVKVVDVINS